MRLNESLEKIYEKIVEESKLDPLLAKFVKSIQGAKIIASPSKTVVEVTFGEHKFRIEEVE